MLGVGGGKERCVGRWESVWGEWGSVLACGERIWGRCREVCCGVGPQHTFNSPHLSTLTFPYISPYLPHTPSHFPTPPFIPLPTSLLPPPTPQHIFLLSPHLPSPFQSLAKLPCDEVSVMKLPCGEVTGNPVKPHYIPVPPVLSSKYSILKKLPIIQVRAVQLAGPRANFGPQSNFFVPR